ncbi:unnamed protein product [Rhodiola kirilowii]
MIAELKALNSNNTWEITDLPQGKNYVGSKWIYRIKRNSDGTIQRYKERLVARDFTQLEGLDYHETFAPVVKMNTIRALLAVAISKGWPLFQLDVDNAFLHDHLDEESVMTYIHDLFRIKDLGQLRYFLGFEVARSSEGLFLSQRKYALELIADAGLLACKPSSIPMDTKHKLGLSTASILADLSPYRRLVGKLIYLTNTRPDIAYSVHMLSQFMTQPTEDHLSAAHKVLRYLKMAPAQGLFYPSHQPLKLETHCDADWGACPLTKKSIIGYTVTLGQALIFWKTKKQAIVFRSCAEAEYRVIAHACCEVAWLVRLLADLQRTKHVELDCHVVRQHLTSGLISPHFLPTSDQLVDLLTKALSADHLQHLSGKLNVLNTLHTLSLRGGGVKEPVKG